MRHRMPVRHGSDQMLVVRPCARRNVPAAVEKLTPVQQQQYAKPGSGERRETEAKLGQRRAVRVDRPDRGIGQVRCRGDSERNERGGAPCDPRQQSIRRSAGHGIGTHRWEPPCRRTTGRYAARHSGSRSITGYRIAPA
jgi:hypothetical protein